MLKKNQSPNKQDKKTDPIDTVYRRNLPAVTTAFSSKKGKLLFKEALLADTMANYFKLAEQFTTQSDPSFCGPATLIMILNSLAIDPNKTWKGIWRWYTESVLHCTSEQVMKNGMSLEEMTQLARCNGLHTMTFQPNDDSPLSLRCLDY